MEIIEIMDRPDIPFNGRYPDLIWKYRRSVKDMMVMHSLTSFIQWYNCFFFLY